MCNRHLLLRCLSILVLALLNLSYLKAQVGYTAVNASVGENGDAKIVIPVNCPKGTFIQPNLALSYSSHAGNGLQGMGFNLDGIFQAISRVPATIAQDGVYDPVDFDGLDRFALNGERLIAINGTYGADNTEYRTEQNMFSRIRSYGNVANTGPERFLVQTKDGLTLEFGYSTDSRIEGPGNTRVITWLLNKITDTNGNYLVISYQEEVVDGFAEFRPISIAYTGNSVKNLQPYNKVVFSYEKRPDIVPKYFSGQNFRLSYRLKEITTYEKSTIFRKYQLTYSGYSGNSKLARVTEFGLGGSLVIRPVDINWKVPETANYNFNKIGSGEWSGHGGGPSNNIVGDFNGDGKSDMAGYTNEGGKWHVAISTGTNFSTSFWYGHANGLANTIAGDFNGDGRTDLAGYAGNGKFNVSISTGTGFTNSLWNGHPSNVAGNVAGDFNGDGRTDIAGYLGGDKWSICLSSGSSFAATTWAGHAGGLADRNVVGDFNGDGRTDLAGYTGDYAKWHVCLSTGTGFENFFWNGPFVGKNGNRNAFIGDYNGDGLSDMASYANTNGTWAINFSTGTGFVQVGWLGHRGSETNNVLGDYNGDGLTDLMGCSAPGSWHVSLSTGYSFNSSYSWQGHGGTQTNNAVGDFDGDGLTDIAGYKGTNGLWHVTLSNNVKEFVASIRNGNGVTTSFSYQPLTDPNTYKKGSGAVYPLVDFIGAMYVVKSISSNDGVGGSRTVSYFYENAKLDLSGRGFRGFEKITTSDPTVKSIITTTYDRNFQNIAARVVKTELKTSNGQLVKLVENQIQKLAMHNGKVFFSYYIKTSEKNYEPGQSAPYATKDTDFEYDAYGNPTKIAERYNYSSNYQVVTTNRYTNDESRWLLGRLLESTVTKTLAGKSSITKNSTFAYDGNGNLITEIFLPANATRKVQTDYTLDVFGNRIRKTISGSGFSSRSENFTMDVEGRNVLSVSNALGHTTSFAYTNGMLTSETDANGLVTRTTLDAFGRAIRVDYPDGTWETTNYFYCGTGSGFCPADAIYYVENKTSSGLTSRSYFDVLDRVTWEEEDAFAGLLMKTIDHAYNADGTKKAVSDAYLAGAVVYWTNYEYDVLQRLVRETRPGSRVSTITYSGLTKTVTNAEGQVNVTTQNPMGKIMSVTDALGNTLNYDYDSDLNTTAVRYPSGHSIINTFDIAGFKLSTADPDMGKYLYEYNALGLQTKQTNAKGEVTTIEYDLLNRPIKKVEPEGTSTWGYDPTNAKGQVGTLSYNGVVVETYQYNTKSQLIGKTHTQNGQSRKFSYTYNATNGAVEVETFPNGYAVKHIYNSRGYEVEVRNNATNITLWKADSYDQDDKLTGFTLGNGLKTTRTFDIISGDLTKIQTGTASNPAVAQNMSFDYSPLGNLKTRRDALFSLTENLGYDKLNRLIASTTIRFGASGNQTVAVNYDALGNITYKSDVGAYRYGENGAGPHVLTSIEHSNTTTCIYPLNQDISYTSYNYVSRVANKNTEILFGYGPNRSRQSVVVKKTGKIVMDKAIYGGVYEEIKDANGTITTVCYLSGGGEVFAFYSKTGTQAEKITYLLKDHLGSVYAHASQAGVVEQRFSYDAWGKPRNPETWAALTTIPNTPNFQRGFTFHEMLDIDGLICMNARVYNPILGRFLSPDPFVQNPEDLQSYNRYSYVLNNPLTLIDPTGYFSLKKFFKEFAGLIVGVAITVATGGAGLPILVSGALAGFGSAFTNALVNGAGVGDAFKAGFQGGAIGAISAGVAYGVGSGFAPIIKNNPAYFRELIVAKALVHGVTQGTVSDAFGGDFKSSFVGAFVSNLGYDAIESSEYFSSAGSRVIASAVVGGTASELSGGKFANGAFSAAFTAMFNEESHREEITYEEFTEVAVEIIGLVIIIRVAPSLLPLGAELLAIRRTAKLSTSGLKLSKQLASEAQMASKGKVIAKGNEVKQFNRLKQEYGGGEWVKKSSNSYIAKDGTKFETHWFENLTTGQRVGQKTKFVNH